MERSNWGGEELVLPDSGETEEEEEGGGGGGKKEGRKEVRKKALTTSYWKSLKPVRTLFQSATVVMAEC